MGFWVVVPLLIIATGSSLALAIRPATDQSLGEPYIGYRLEWYWQDVVVGALITVVGVIGAGLLYITVSGARAIAYLVLAALIISVPAAFKIEHLNQNELLFIEQGKSLAKTYRGEADVVIARWTNTRPGSAGFQGARIAPEDLQTISCDGLRVDVELSFAYTINAAAPDDPNFARALWRLGPLDGIRENQAIPQAKMAVREVIGQRTAMDLATVDREKVRTAISTRLEELLGNQRLKLLAVTLGQIRIDERFHDAYVRALAEQQANMFINPSLSPAILEQQRIHALTSANTVIIPAAQRLHLVTHGESPTGTESPA